MRGHNIVADVLMDGPMDRPTDEPSYRVAYQQLKVNSIHKCAILLNLRVKSGKCC